MLYGVEKTTSDCVGRDPNLIPNGPQGDRWKSGTCRSTLPEKKPNHKLLPCSDTSDARVICIALIDIDWGGQLFRYGNSKYVSSFPPPPPPPVAAATTTTAVCIGVHVLFGFLHCHHHRRRRHHHHHHLRHHCRRRRQRHFKVNACQFFSNQSSYVCANVTSWRQQHSWHPPQRRAEEDRRCPQLHQ